MNLNQLKDTSLFTSTQITPLNGYGKIQFANRKWLF